MDADVRRVLSLAHGVWREVAKPICVYLRPSAVTLMLLAAAPAWADVKQNDARAEALFREVRCIQCQSETIADSNAPIAQDMRRMIREDIAAGKSDADIRDSLVARYSDYVLFRPRMTKANLLLWLTPLVVVLAGGFSLWFWRKRRDVSKNYELSDEENEKLRRILDSRD